MNVLTVLTLVVLCTVKVQCVQESPTCPRKESVPGVLTLNLGSEVILGCRGDVTVDGISLVMGAKHKERLENRGDGTNQWRPQKARESFLNISKHLDPVNNTTTGNYNSNTATETNDRVGKFVTSDNSVMNIEKEQMGSRGISQAVNQSTKSTSGVGRVTEEGGAFSVIMEMGTSTESNTGTEYEDDEEYKEKMEGLRVTRSSKRQAQWTRNGQLMRDGVERGGVFRLSALRLIDSGNYSCYRRGKLVSSVKISVGIPPVSPNLSCHKKSHISKIRCEWISRQPIIPHPQCYLIHRRGLEISRVNCSYSAKFSRCWCVLPSEESDRNLYTAKLCVTNTAGNVTSSPYNYIPQNIIKPDPPTRVTVNPVIFEPHTLKVTWSLPTTWRQSFYYSLHFQLRYRPKHAKQYQQVEREDTELLWFISDALPHVDYEVQIRTKDEYDGQWSDWTSPVYARTWAASTTTDGPDTSLEPFWIFPEGSGGSEEEDGADHVDAVLWVHVLWVVGFPLLIIIIILSAYALRRRMSFMPKKSRESVSSTSSCSSPSPFIQQHLITVKRSCQEGEGVHLHNVDYFFPACESYRS